MSVDKGLIARRVASSVIDWSIEMIGGLLGSYFGVMLAALIVAMKGGAAEQMESSMKIGFGFGFVFWTLSVSFLNRVLIQGVSRSSIGKKIFKLELISTAKPLDWTTVMKRWLASYASIAFGGMGYTYMFFDAEGRAFHDVVAHTDVVPIFEGSSMSVESHSEAVNISEYKPVAPMGSRTITLQPSLAKVIELRPAEQDDETKKAA